MKLKYWMIAKAIIVVLFGLCFVFLPKTIMGFYGMTLDDAGAFMTQLLGQAFILLGILLWSNRNAADTATQRSFALAVFIGDMIGLGVSLIGQLGGVTNALGWTTVALYLILGLRFGYFLLPR